MPDLVHLAMLAGGLVLLALAGDALVRGAASLARHMGVSSLFAGIVIVGFGTSLPEMVVAVDAAARGVEGLAFGNIVGSNIANLWFVLALPALIAPVLLQGEGLRRVLAATVLATAAWIGVTGFSALSPAVGMAFLAGLVLYVVTVLLTGRAAHRAGRVANAAPEPASPLPVGQAVLFAVAGVIGLPLAANLLIRGAVGVAEFFQVSDRVIGLTLLAVGTSLPEIAAAIAASFRRQGGLIIGNVMGSNLFNILGAGGVVALFGPFRAAPEFQAYDHWFMAASLLVIGVGILLGARIGRLGGLLLLLLYALYVTGLVSGWDISGLIGLSVTPAA